MRAEDADWRCRHHVAASMPWVVGAMGWQGSACSLLPPILGRARGCCGHPMVGTGAGEPRLSPRTRPLGRDVLDWGLGQFWVCGTVPSGHALWGSDSGCRAVPREGGSPHRRCPEDVPAGRAWHPPPRQGTAPGVLLSSPRPPATSGRHRPPCPCLSPSSRCPHPGGLGAASSRGGHRGLPGQGRDTPPQAEHCGLVWGARGGGRVLAAQLQQGRGAQLPPYRGGGGRHITGGKPCINRGGCDPTRPVQHRGGGGRGGGRAAASSVPGGAVCAGGFAARRGSVRCRGGSRALPENISVSPGGGVGVGGGPGVGALPRGIRAFSGGGGGVGALPAGRCVPGGVVALPGGPAQGDAAGAAGALCGPLSP